MSPFLLIAKDLSSTHFTEFDIINLLSIYHHCKPPTVYKMLPWYVVKLIQLQVGEWANADNWRLLTSCFVYMEVVRPSRGRKTSAALRSYPNTEKAVGVNPHRKLRMEFQKRLSVNTDNFPATSADKPSSNLIPCFRFDIVGMNMWGAL